MAFKYHPPTRSECTVCDDLQKERQSPIIKANGNASSANGFPIHNWYHFVLGYSPEFPNYIIKKENITRDNHVLDPFVGAGTTLVCCKFIGVPSYGLDANDYFVDVSRGKLDWTIDLNLVKKVRDQLLAAIYREFEGIDFEENEGSQLRLISKDPSGSTASEYARANRPVMIDSRYISDRPFVKSHIIKKLIDKQVKDQSAKRLFDLAISATLIPSSNIKYGPGFGVTKPKLDADVLGIFKDKINRMIADLENVPDHTRRVISEVKLGDSRKLCSYYDANMFDYIITSPPYPGDHEYTKHTRLELLFMNYANDLPSLRRIKERMIRGSTTNIYKNDADGDNIKEFESIKNVTNLIEKRLAEDGATSGFEKLYTKLVREYFGGMQRVLSEALTVLKRGGKFVLLVSDSHAFKMVHISTASILAEIGLKTGYKSFEMELWQDKISTSHKYHMRENILTLIK